MCRSTCATTRAAQRRRRSATWPSRALRRSPRTWATSNGYRLCSTLSLCTPHCTASYSRTHAHTHTRTLAPFSFLVCTQDLAPIAQDHTLTHTTHILCAQLYCWKDTLYALTRHSHSLNAGRWPERGGSLIPPRSRFAVQKSPFPVIALLQCSISFIPIDAQCDSFCKWNLINVPLSKHCFVCSSRQI